MESRGTVLIVGGSAGIGLATAHEFAAHGFDLLLVARGSDRLTVAAGAIRVRHFRKVAILALDATETGSPERIMAAIQDCPLPLRYAVIGVGAWNAGDQLETETDTLRSIIETNVVAPHALLRMIVPQLAPGGGILLISSLAGFLPLPWMSVYAASKSHLNSSTLALRQELHSSSVSVCLLAPGIVRTEFVPHARSARWRLLFNVIASSPETVAHSAFRGLVANVPVIVPGLLWRFMWFGIRILPSSLLAWLLHWIMRTIRLLVQNARPVHGSKKALP